MHIMSSYHSSFKYLDKKSDEDFGWIIAHFDPDNGETDSYLSQEQIYSDSYNGTKRTLYGTKYTTVANVKITVIKQDGSDFSLSECRNAYKWLTGNPEASWMDLYIGDEVKYRLLCTIQDVKPQKMDARTVGLNIYCESLSPWAYSPVQTAKFKDGIFLVKNGSDDLYNAIYPKIIYTNRSETSVTIRNLNTLETTKITGLAAGEIVTLDCNMMITSSIPGKTFGNSFNFVWPRLTTENNRFEFKGDGEITFEYYWPIKIGDCATDINVVRDPICDEYNNIQVDMLPWDRISNTPTTAAGYGLTDVYTVSSVYNKNEIDSKLKAVSDEAKSAAYLASTVSSNLSSNYYNKNEIDSMVYTKEEARDQISDIRESIESNTSLINDVSDVAESAASLASNINSNLQNNYYTKTNIENNYYNKDQIDNTVYTKKQVDKKIDDVMFDVDSNASLISTVSSQLNNYQDYVEDKYYTKSEIDNIIAELEYDPSTGDSNAVIWSQITGKPTTLSGYGVKSEVQGMIDQSVNAIDAYTKSEAYSKSEVDAKIASVDVSIDEQELNDMLEAILGESSSGTTISLPNAEGRLF